MVGVWSESDGIKNACSCTDWLEIFFGFKLVFTIALLFLALFFPRFFSMQAEKKRICEGKKNLCTTLLFF